MRNYIVDYIYHGNIFAGIAAANNQFTLSKCNFNCSEFQEKSSDLHKNCLDHQHKSPDYQKSKNAEGSDVKQLSLFLKTPNKNKSEHESEDLSSCGQTLENKGVLNTSKDTCHEHDPDTLFSDPSTDSALASISKGLLEPTSKTSISSLFSQPSSSSERKDVCYKAALRLFRRFFKKTFKACNQDMYKRRFSNYTIDDIYQQVCLMLMKLVPAEYITQDLVYFTIGIIGAKKASQLPCRDSIKSQITTIQACCKNFSRKKFNRIMASKSLRVLTMSFTDKIDDPRVSILREELE
ncbi:unnamed protein product [Moneuplotes crassus]|uniref:Uncharacterized protein n=1 Tax=Euplotes crassus TaxID=5936 RepID=A0AAD1XG32_EUPCR|nr:unnamed protein product [Moneuplotes crassus]